MSDRVKPEVMGEFIKVYLSTGRPALVRISEIQMICVDNIDKDLTCLWLNGGYEKYIRVAHDAADFFKLIVDKYTPGNLGVPLTASAIEGILTQFQEEFNEHLETATSEVDYLNARDHAIDLMRETAYHLAHGVPVK